MDCEPFCLERYLRVNLLRPGLCLIKKNLPGRGLRKVGKHCSRMRKLRVVHRYSTLSEATLCARAGGFCFTRRLSTPQGFSGRSVSIDGGWIGVRVRFLCYSSANVYKSHSEQFLSITVWTYVFCMLGRILKC